MPSNVKPLPLVQRYVPGQVFAQDILGSIEAFACAAWSQETAPISYNGRHYDPSYFKTPEQLHALGCGNRINFPYADPERVNYFDVVRRLAPPVAFTDTAIAFELVRMPIERWSVAVLERIATYVRGQRLDPDGGPVDAPIIFGGNLINLADAGGGTDPCPFPLPPTPGINGTPGLRLRFHLIRYVYSRNVPDDPPFYVGPESAIPPGDVISPWTDMRYAWGSMYSGGHKWVEGGHALLRLFAGIETFDGAPGSSWLLNFCTRLSGYTQQAGPVGAAQRSALWRV